MNIVWCVGDGEVNPDEECDIKGNSSVHGQGCFECQIEECSVDDECIDETQLCFQEFCNQSGRVESNLRALYSLFICEDPSEPYFCSSREITCEPGNTVLLASKFA